MRFSQVELEWESAKDCRKRSRGRREKAKRRKGRNHLFLSINRSISLRKLKRKLSFCITEFAYRQLQTIRSGFILRILLRSVFSVYGMEWADGWLRIWPLSIPVFLITLLEMRIWSALHIIFYFLLSVGVLVGLDGGGFDCELCGSRLEHLLFEYLRPWWSAEDWLILF
ncbi:hypothetical protein KFK09_019047 [Dendrobium nobile]|uniref:Uncharacterized protein n=1 Tax=Dendrobium nobile TaxID=94219 RepID=A0A8T3AXH9_DENNO|nr:hypothetical protein KFK09_019047 [Dendrobium nobile]